MAIVYEDFEIEIVKTRHGEYVLRNKIGGVSMNITLDSRSMTARLDENSGARRRTEAREFEMTLYVSK